MRYQISISENYKEDYNNCLLLSFLLFNDVILIKILENKKVEL